MTSRVEVSRVTSASAEVLWDLVSDVTAMGRWSPEATGGRWLGTSRGPAVGAKFEGFNARANRRWRTTCTVVRAERGVAFAFSVKGAGLSVAEWEYVFDRVDGGCRVTEIWTDRRGLPLKVFGRLALGIANRAEHNRANMEKTLAALCRAAEAH